MADIKNNLRASIAPMATDDSSVGYSEGSQWFNKATGVLWVATSVAVGAARWVPHQPGLDAWPSNTYRKPANFGGGVVDVTPVAVDALYLLPFLVTRAIARAGVPLITAGSSGAAASFGIYGTDPSTRKPDGMPRLQNIGAVDLSAGAPAAKATGAVSLDLPPGLYWLGTHFKGAGITTMPVLKGMDKCNGLYVLSSSMNDLLNSFVYQAYYSAQTYVSGQVPGTCPVTTLNANPVPMSLLLSQ